MQKMPRKKQATALLDKPIFDPSKLSMLEFKLLKGQIDTPEDFNIDYCNGHHLDNSFQIGINLTDNLVKADFVIEIKTESEGKNSSEATGSFHMIFIYEVKNLNELATPNENKSSVEVDQLLGNALSSITYSTARGILLTRLQGTALQHFILPIINPNSLLQNN